MIIVISTARVALKSLGKRKRVPTRRQEAQTTVDGKYSAPLTKHDMYESNVANANALPLTPYFKVG